MSEESSMSTYALPFRDVEKEGILKGIAEVRGTAPEPRFAPDAETYLVGKRITRRTDPKVVADNLTKRLISFEGYLRLHSRMWMAPFLETANAFNLLAGIDFEKWADEITFQVAKPAKRKEDPIQVLEQQREIFMGNLRSLLKTEYRGEFIAMLDGEIIAHDKDNRELAKRVYKEYGYVPIYIDKVERKREVVRMPSPMV